MIIREMDQATSYYRVLALSATPGAQVKTIQEVITNLKISHIESKSADDPDVRYVMYCYSDEDRNEHFAENIHI